MKKVTFNQQKPDPDETVEIKAMLRCTPFLLFDGNCAKAMTFYQ